jgi:hypothetical protein
MDKVMPGDLRVRLTLAIRETLARRATENMRSLSREVLHRLQTSIEQEQQRA